MKANLVWILMALMACSRQEGVSGDGAFRIGLQDTLIVNFEGVPLPDENSTLGFLDQSIYFTYEFKDSLGLYIEDTVHSTWNASYFDLHGSNGIKKHGEFVLINDTLAFHPLKGMSSFQLVDMNTREVKEFEFKDSKIGVSNAKHGSIYFDGELVGFPLSYYYEVNSIDYTKKAPIYGFYSLESLDFVKFIYYPEEFQNDIYSFNYLKSSFLVVKELLYLNMQKSHSIYIINTKNIQVGKELVLIDGVSNENFGYTTDMFKSMVDSEISGRYLNLFFDGQYFYRTAMTFPGFTIDEVKGFQDVVAAMDRAVFHVVKMDKNLSLISQGEFSASPSRKGIGDGFSFVKGGKLYLWLLDKEQDNEEKFVSIN